ncbi:DNA polymerase III subunit gamma and tau [Leucobacter aridicollis]|uniref:DNA polymerase III subunit gamma and tau n=2 Tax=Leucobacter aridicollis TaxID=283878 RepID=UPI0027DD8CE1|nr:DNA polymerase III subunit gamma and tau [Leucobacter aridicollis]
MVAALYRRYRPESFSEMIGQSQVTDPLMTALRTGRVGHAYLFSGPRGCGKTTSARILARCLNCAEGPTDTPCGTCPSCVELSRAGGGSLDVVEIDAASHGGVDDARDLRERAVFAPARDRFKIFIIDEAHMVTAGGFNALLKIVEEPPPHVKFIFATTEPEKVIGTIRSRTHHYPFRLIPPAALIDYVQQLCDSEGVAVEPGVLPLVVRSGGGSARDTLSILDQLIAGSEGNSVSAERAAGLLGFTHTELLDDVVAALGSGDPAAAFTATDRVIQTGQDPRRFVEDLLERLRDLIIVNATSIDGAAAVLRGVPQDQLDRMFEQARAFGARELSRTADTVSEALDQMTGATPPRLHLELMIARALVELSGADTHDVHAPAPGSGAPHPRQAAQSPGAAPRQGAAPAAPVPGGAATTDTSAPSAPTHPASGQAGQAAATQGAGAPGQNTGAPAPAAPSPAAPKPERVANAAETAASIREFLRNEDAGTTTQQNQPAAQAQPAPTQAPAAPAQNAQGPTAGPATPAAQQATDERDNPAASKQPAAPRDAGPQPADGERGTHPNEGAAGFGRPISDILSAAQIASIGTEPTTPAPAAPAAPAAPVAQPPAGQQSSAAAQSDGRPEPESGISAAAAAPADAPTEDAEGAAAAQSDELAGFEDLREMWPDLLEELLESNREAWNAVRAIEPLGLEDDLLLVGVANRSDLEAFKSAGAGPLRETILEATGIRVRYAPRQVTTARESQEQSQPPVGTGDSEEPHRGSPAPVTPPVDDLAERAAARLSSLGPKLAAPAWADPIPEPVAQNDSAPAQATSTSGDKPAPAPTGPAPAQPQASREMAAANTPSTHTERAPQSDPDPSGPSAQPEAPGAKVMPGTGTRDDDGYGDDSPYGDGPSYSDDEYGYPDGDPYAFGGRASSGRPGAGGTAAQATPVAPVAPVAQAAPAVQAGPAVHAAPAASVSPAGPATAGAAEAVPPAAVSQAAASPGDTGSPASGGAKAAPKFTRYGEAVVREVLGAVFVEERPLPEPRR